ncbi:TetR/AcrR family transcriptional regulator [Bifidobacterium eulemuris]|uniref:TetR-type transcriptional regulator n=1 Tax=Bifidobacterium eulemuris TaxID=1765219 RepID=A0A261GEG1_9BIFI|nr:TetR-like C-terminal domain-containing protein [Bifidobacterium eulemuris]OZG69326.1 TetR-type transcriptional regulator [Bifidobacterium eulemuris]QOL31177.1 TetR/AcrR family transcriptional regulator [Bifidobacterium eulemuris]
MVMKQPEVTAKTRNRLRRAFWMLYERQPIEKITVRQITDLAGYNRATFYMYYTSVLDLREHVEDDFITRRITAIRDAIVDFSDPDSIRINLAAFLDQSARDKPFLKVLLGPHGDPAFVEKMKEAVKPLMMPLVERHISKDATPLHAEYVREFYFSGVLAVVRRWLTDPDPMPTEELLELIVGVFMPDVSVE